MGAGEKVVDVPPKLAARARLLDNGETNKNDPNDARSVAVAALRAKRLSEITKEDHAAVMRLWARRRKDLTSSRTRVANRLHAVILELVPGGYAGEIYANKVARLRSHFAAYNGSAPIEVSSGPKKLYRLSMRGSRQLNHALHMAAVTQVRHAHSEGRAYYDRKVTEGKTHKEALRARKRRISDALYAAMVADARRERQEERANRVAANHVSIEVELQADCYAGVWANLANASHKILEPGDLESGLQAASSVGDDTLQKRMQGTVVPDSFTHGTSAQRVRWFRSGFGSGSLDSCDTFSAGTSL